MLAFSEISVKTKQETETVGSYIVSPLPKGYGNSLANVMRRILLSSLEGAGITSVKINGVKHEYSALDGIREDVLEILLNLKNLRFRCPVSDKQLCYIDVKGEKLVTAKDIKCPNGVEVTNPEEVVANLTSKDAELKIELVVEKGVGYREADESLRSEIGRIPLDTDFSPIKKVFIETGKSRKGQETELDSVIIDIETDGSIDPKEALMSSVKIMQDFAGKVMVALGMSKLEVEELAASTTAVTEAESNSTETQNANYAIRIEDLNISKRSKTGLLNGGYETLGDLVDLSEKDLSKLPGFGAKSLNEVLFMLEQHGIVLKEE